MNVLLIGRSSPCPGVGVNGLSRGLGPVSNIAAKVYQLTLRFFSLGSSAFLVGFGVKELFVDFVLLRSRLKKKRSEARLFSIEEVADRAFYHLKKVENVFAEYSLIHGSLYLGSGIFGGLASMHDLQWFTLGRAMPFAKYLGSGLFLYLNLYSLEQNMKLFSHAQNMSKSGNSDLRSFANRLQASSVLGMINNIGYILAILTSFFPATLAIAIALAVFAFSVGTLKIIYDYCYVGPKFEQVT
ncbi:MAG: hypothetical protein ACE5GN_04395 [Waddliaceae bacterium]